MVEKNKATKIQSNLHLIYFPKQNQHIFFVSDPAHVKRDFKIVDLATKASDSYEEPE